MNGDERRRSKTEKETRDRETRDTRTRRGQLQFILFQSSFTLFQSLLFLPLLFPSPLIFFSSYPLLYSFPPILPLLGPFPPCISFFFSHFHPFLPILPSNTRGCAHARGALGLAFLEVVTCASPERDPTGPLFE